VVIVLGWEEVTLLAIALTNWASSATGNLVLTGNFAMNYKSNPSGGSAAETGQRMPVWSSVAAHT